nr:type II toxin-antitoxin system VapC family toxin [Candidatus Baldrarchaeota archaeon]
MKFVEELLKALELVNFDEKMARISGAVLVELRREGQMVDIRDLFISAAAIALEDKIATKNIRHFGRIKKLEVELW